jgi:arylformamidase
MASVDYEAEYNNRARVPDHPAIFARWVRAAADYRSQAAQERRVEIGIAYGQTARQQLDLFWPPERTATKLALFVHGGYWRSLDRATFSHVGRGLNAHGVTVAVAGYDLCPAVGVGDIVQAIRAACHYLWRRFGARMLVYGHSAGGQLAACMLATDWLHAGGDLPADLVPAACAISGVFDLTPLVGLAMNADLRLDVAEARRQSPLWLPPPQGRTLQIVVGALESAEFLRQSRILADVWGRSGVTIGLQEVPGTNHFTVLDAFSEPESALTRGLAALVDTVAAKP